MSRLATRRLRNLGVLAIVAVVVVASEAALSSRLVRTSFATGWLLLALVVGLAAYNVRKKVPFLTLGPSASWLQVHIYAGLLSGIVFALHVEFRIPNGTFESVLASLYLTVFLSGLGGLALTRAIPPRLTSRGEEVIFERIPVRMKGIRDEVEVLVYTSASDSETAVIPDIYLQQLKAFFERPRNRFWHLLHFGRPRQRLLLEIQSQKRFLNDSEQAVLQDIADCVTAKDDLDYQFALQAALKTWLFVHVPLTYSLLVLAVFHLIVVHAFAGGM